MHPSIEYFLRRPLISFEKWNAERLKLKRDTERAYRELTGIEDVDADTVQEMSRDRSLDVALWVANKQRKAV